MRSEKQLRPKAAWIPGTARRYESFWILLQKLMLLNRPARSDLAEIFSARSCGVRQQYASKSTSIGPFPPRLRLHDLARILGERVATLRYCTGAPFEKKRILLFDQRMRFCPQCFAYGFHTVLFNVTGMARCPLHHCLLSWTCPACRQPIETLLTDEIIEHPGRCQCGYIFVPANFLTRPHLSRQELQFFDPLVRWLHACTDRVAFDVSRYDAVHLAEESAIHTPHWPAILGVRPPQFLSTIHFSPVPLVRHDSGMRVNPVATSNSFRINRPYTAIYKSLRRHFTKRCLHNRMCHYIALSAQAQCGNIRNEKIVTGDAPYAFVLLLWRQYVEGWNSLCDPGECRNLTRYQDGYWSQVEDRFVLREIVRVEREAFTRLAMKRTNHVESEWLEHRLFAEGLMATWHQTVHRVWAWLATGQHYYGQPLGATIAFSSCSCVRNRQGKLTLLLPLTQRAAAIDRPDTYQDKATRIAIEQEQRTERWAALKEKLTASPFVLEWSSDGGWSTQRAQYPQNAADALDLKKRALCLPTRQLPFILFRIEHAGYAARLLEFPVQTFATHPRGAIMQLKRAVTAYMTIISAR